MNQRHPFVIIGGGLAGLTAAWSLDRAGYSSIVLERAPRPGGRAATHEARSWRADVGCPFFERRDRTIVDLCRRVGLESDVVIVQGAVGTMLANGQPAPLTADNFRTDRLALRRGLGSLMDALGKHTHVVPGTVVTAIRWDEEDQTFWFETEGGAPINANGPGSELLVTDGVIIATNAVMAGWIARRSPSLTPLVPALDGTKMEPAISAAFLVPKVHRTWFALRGVAEAPFRLFAIEERKTPHRAPEGMSVVVAIASPFLSAPLLGRADVAMEIYREARKVLPEMPEKPIESHVTVWPAGWHSAPPLATASPQAFAHPTSPDGLPVALAGDYVLGWRAEDAARSGLMAAGQLIERHQAHAALGRSVF